MAKAKKQQPVEDAASESPVVEAAPESKSSKRSSKATSTKSAASAKSATSAKGAASGAPDAAPQAAAGRKKPKAAKPVETVPASEPARTQVSSPTPISAPPPAPISTPAFSTIDTGLAAQAAANMVVHRDLIVDANTARQPQETSKAPSPTSSKQESAHFKQLKQGLNKPMGTGLASLLGPTGANKKSNAAFGAGGTTFRNQTTGGFNRAGVPRRTGG